MVENIAEALDADAYPHLDGFTFENVLRPGYDFSNSFEFGLDLVLTAVGNPRSER